MDPPSMGDKDLIISMTDHYGNPLSHTFLHNFPISYQSVQWKLVTLDFPNLFASMSGRKPLVTHSENRMD